LVFPLVFFSVNLVDLVAGQRFVFVFFVAPFSPTLLFLSVSFHVDRDQPDPIHSFSPLHFQPFAMLFPNVATALLVSASIVSGLSIQARDTDFHAIRRARLEARQNNNFRNGGNGNNGNQFNRNGQNNGQGNNNNNNNNAAASSAAAAATPATGGNNNNNNNNAAAAKTLNANAVQTGSAATGQTGVIAAGQVESAV
jgi:hypothetical protein